MEPGLKERNKDKERILMHLGMYIRVIEKGKKGQDLEPLHLIMVPPTKEIEAEILLMEMER